MCSGQLEIKQITFERYKLIYNVVIIMVFYFLMKLI